MPQNEMPPTDEQKAEALKEAEKRGPQPLPDRRIRPDKNGRFVSKPLTLDDVKNMMPYYADMDIPPSWLHPFKRIAWNHKLFKERRKLKADLRENYGMRLKPRDFNKLCTEVGLGLESKALTALWLIWHWLFGFGGLATVLGVALLTLCGIFLWSAIAELAGSFTVQINNNTMQSNFVLSETPGFEKKTGRLVSTELTKVNAMTLYDLPEDIDEGDGVKNGTHYAAYSFYIMNDGDTTDRYEYVVHMTDSTKGAEYATWLMLFEDGKQVIYAEPSGDGDPERLAGYYKEAPFYESSYDPQKQYYKKSADIWGVETTPFESHEIVVRGLVENIKPGESHKYTVVVWLEGYDPECTDNLFDGYTRFYIEFRTVDDERIDLFSNLYRREFEEPIAELPPREDGSNDDSITKRSE